MASKYNIGVAPDSCDGPWLVAPKRHSSCGPRRSVPDNPRLGGPLPPEGLQQLIPSSRPPGRRPRPTTQAAHWAHETHALSDGTGRLTLYNQASLCSALAAVEDQVTRAPSDRACRCILVGATSATPYLGASIRYSSKYPSPRHPYVATPPVGGVPKDLTLCAAGWPDR